MSLCFSYFCLPKGIHSRRDLVSKMAILLSIRYMFVKHHHGKVGCSGLSALIFATQWSSHNKGTAITFWPHFTPPPHTYILLVDRQDRKVMVCYVCDRSWLNNMIVTSFTYLWTKDNKTWIYCYFWLLWNERIKKQEIMWIKTFSLYSGLKKT